MAVEMTQKMEEYLVDPTLSQWLLPGFSTTTDHDRIVGSVVMMASMKKYFTYKFCLECGIPSITLLGTVADWLAIRARVDKLQEYGLGEWVVMLASILDQFVAAAIDNVDTSFWQRIWYKDGAGRVLATPVARSAPFVSSTKMASGKAVTSLSGFTMTN
ncbi:Aste57867_15673 [Aphanomyces stellatus]|uniref:Aste57867_15673 protein n=1 Tax=Aphanomyces stellatus TaxID=120398 RepID=A0A485L501_9STRA|nr:hypothetical protein As57867_015617 [Aphanomyces stellatus]VFT92467.1 Aste57867_15673 [Aphanomyces stellatus]